MFNFRFLLLSLGVLIFSACAHAAEFTKFPLKLSPTSEMSAIRVSGLIEAGDTADFEDIIAKNSPILRRSIYLSLNSPGGDLVEAIAFAKLIRKIGFYTIVEENSSCISACFILYAAGFARMGQLPLVRSADEVTNIGVHRAFIDRADMAKLSPSEASDVVRRLTALSSKALRELDITDDTIQLIQKTPAAGVRFLTVGQLSAIPTPPWFDDLAIARCKLTLPANNTPESFAYFKRLAECQAEVIFDHHFKQFSANQ